MKLKPVLTLFIICFNVLVVFSQNYSWQKPHAKVLPNGDLQWEPKSFNYTPGSSVLYIDYESGDDNNLGTDKSSPWKHHPWDPDATGNADASSGIHTYVFKKGVVYRGKLIAEESGNTSEPIRLTSDPSWGNGEACIYASERITGGWQRCTSTEAPKIPHPEMVWYKDVGSMIPYKTEMVCEITDADITRVKVARSPNWTITDKNFPMKNWWIIDDAEGDWVVDNKHFIQSDQDYWEGATIWTQWGPANMATPVRGEITEFDPDNHRVKVDSRADKDCYYYIENLPQLLDQPNEFYYNKENSRLFIRLKDDRNPNHSVIEVGVRGKNIIIEDKHHIEISGLSFAFNNIPNKKSYGHHTVQETNEVFIRIEGECHSIEVSNCKFRYVVDGIGVHNENDPIHVMHDIRITDNDFAYVDDQAITFGNFDCNYFDFYPDNEKAYSVLRDVSILRNKVYYSGSRQTSGFWSQIPAIGFGYFQSGEIAGNILDYCWGSGINVYWGKSVGSDATVNAVPYIRGLIHHNKVTNSMLVNNDYGGIESWGGGPTYIYNNISENARGNRNYGVDKDWGVEWTPFGMAFYIDHAYKHYLFNNIAIGLHNSLEDATKRNAIAFQHVKGFLNLFANNTAYKFTKPFSSMGNGAQRVFYLGNVLEDITYKYFHTGHDDKSDIPYMSYSNNIFVGDPQKFGRYVTGPYSQTLNQFRTNLANDQAQVSQTGWNASTSVMVDPDGRDFRPLQGGDATDRGVKFFSPWGLYAVVGEWNFYKHTADSSIVMGENFYLGADGVSGEQDNYPKNNLNVVDVSYDDYVYGKLENWTEGALQFDGANTYCYIDDSKSDQYVRTDLDADINNFLIEVYMRTEMSHTGGVLAAKHDKSSNGYALDIDGTGHARLKIITGGTEAYTLSSNTAVNDSNWHHILVEVDRIKGEAQIYVDGAKDHGDSSGSVPGPAVSLSNSADFLAGKDVNENYFAGMIDFLRISKGTLADAHTSIGELYAWEMDGPFTKDFAGNSPDSLRDAGALEYADLPDSLHYLIVNNGMGDGYYPEGAEVRIYGDGPPSDSIFAAWTGDNSYVTDPQKLFTTVNMPDKDITIEAAYTDTKKYTLTVKRGSSSGQYPAGKTIEIIADQSPRDSIFKKWSGDTFAIMNISMANSYVVMPAKDIAIEACYTGVVLSEIFPADIKIYPNPVNNILTIENVSGWGNIQINDVTGSPIKRKSIHSSTVSLNVSDLSDGIYILQIDAGENIITRTLIVKKMTATY